MKNYPFSFRETISDMAEVLRKIIQYRKDDIDDFNNLPNRFVRGRVVGRIPLSSTDVLPDDNKLDMSFQANYLYILIDNSGTLEWRRIPLGVY